MSFEVKLKELNISLPDPPKAIASYIPAKKIGNLIFTSGQLPMKNGVLVSVGRVGETAKIEDAKLAMRQSCLNALAAIKSLTGNLDKIKNIVKLTAFVSSSNDFFEQHLVANEASELLFQIFGETGRHSRSAVGLNSLPLNASVELEMIVEIDE